MRKLTWAVVWSISLLLCLMCLTGVPARAQDPALIFDQVAVRPHGFPQLPPEGAAGELINVTSQWIVFQNEAGQQFPISANDIGQFLVRWPTNADNLGPQSIIQAFARNSGTQWMEVNHVDVFEGADRNLVQPSYYNSLPTNAVISGVVANPSALLNARDYSGPSPLVGWAYPNGPVGGAASAIIHVVGSAVQRYPLVVGLPGNNLATLVPGASGQLTMTQVTRGTLDMAAKGDRAFLIPLGINPKGVAVSQFMLYKSIPFAQFRPGRR